MSRVEQLGLSEICLSLQSDEKKKRLKALEKFENIVSSRDWSKSELLEIWQIMSKHLAKSLTDNAESCRNLSIEITKILLSSLPGLGKNIIYLMPVLVRRLGSQEMIETSEEVRLNCVVLLRVIIKKYEEHLPVYIDDIMVILAKTVIDNYPKIKSESCEAISELARSIPTHFYAKNEMIVQPVLSNFKHQHYRIRVASVKAIGNVLRYGNNKSLPDVASCLAARLFDQSGVVRAAVIEVAGDWLLNLRDRYSWWFKLLPLLLTGLHDEIADIRLKAQTLWCATGKQFLQENESDEKIKDKMDYLTSPPEHYPPGIERPNLGCRIIVQQNLSKLITGICNELDDWLADIRVRSAQLLAVLVLNAEQDTIQHIEKLLPAMYKACADEDNRVAVNVITAAEYMGYFVPPQSYCRLVLPTIQEGNIHFGHLAFFSAILRNSPRQPLVEQLEIIARFLHQSYICRSKKAKYQRELLNCCHALLQVCQEDCVIVSRQLFIAIFTAWSLSHEQVTQNFAKKLLEKLREKSGFETLQDLYISHLPTLLDDLEKTANTWTAHSAEVKIFQLCLTEAYAAALENFNVLLLILRKTMEKDCDVELKLKLFIHLSELFQHRCEFSTGHEDYNKFIVEFLKDILIPYLVWTAGRSAEALRTAAIGCLCAIFDNQVDEIDFKQEVDSTFCDKQLFLPIFQEIKPVLISLVDDNSRKTRLFALRAIYLMINHASKVRGLTEEDIIEIYPGIIRKLDDSCDDIRFAAVETLVFVWKASYKHQFNLDAMMELAEIEPVMLADKIERCKINFRNQKALEKLQDKCRNLIN
ncbi:dynein assembly factor 5, axonemal isoform X2 [Fopius arisanus]|uniref:Dynein assembly factor 5, axonemal isoform X2 n=1 Tax=Fopius arisanus TaxID=64838 RepID=A0A9R1U982_9HYME|nr:PREDICTED: dynein assembly factor 5, axonemal isoform X2 [Fopius arisanus]